MRSSLQKVQDGITVNAYGQGQLAGATFTAPAHGKTEVDIDLQIMCVTPENIENLEKLISSMLNASQKKSFESHRSSFASGGSAFLGLFRYSVGGSTASAHAMSSLGLTEAQQTSIIDQMLKITNKMNSFKMKSEILNTDYDYSVTGNLFGIVMDATIQKGEKHTQVRFLGPKAHLKGDGGEVVPVVAPMYK